MSVFDFIQAEWNETLFSKCKAFKRRRKRHSSHYVNTYKLNESTVYLRKIRFYTIL